MRTWSWLGTQVTSRTNLNRQWNSCRKRKEPALEASPSKKKGKGTQDSEGSEALVRPSEQAEVVADNDQARQQKEIREMGTAER